MSFLNRFSPKYVNEAQEVSADIQKSFERRREGVIRHIERLLSDRNIKYHPEMADEAKDWWLKNVKHLYPHQLRMFALLIGYKYWDGEEVDEIAQENLIKYYYLNHRARRRTTEEVETSNYDRKRRRWVSGTEQKTVRTHHARKEVTHRGVFKLPKTGGGLDIVVLQKDGYYEFAFINRLKNESAEAWAYLSHYVPVAPIYSLKQLPKRNDRTRVVTRFSGYAIGTVQDMATNFDGKTKEQLELLDKEIQRQVQMILAKAWELGVEHGHAHAGNFTVEFIDRDYVVTHMKKLGITNRREDLFLDPRIVNTIPFDGRYISHDPSDYIRKPSKYKVVVRMMDFDRAKITAKYPEDIGKDEQNIQGMTPTEQPLPIKRDAVGHAVDTASWNLRFRPSSVLRGVKEGVLGRNTKPLVVEKYLE